MVDTIDRRVPKHPEIREDGITPAGYGKQGNKPCFCTKIDYVEVFLLHSTVTDPQTAREIFEGLMPTVLESVRDPGDRSASIVVSGRPRHFLLPFHFGHILVKEPDTLTPTVSE